MATKYARAAGGNWSTNATWSTTSGGSADTTKPVSGDTAILDANSGSVTVDTASACANLTMTNYPASKTLTFNADITFDNGGTATLPTAAVTFAGSLGFKTVSAGLTIVPNGNTGRIPTVNLAAATTLTITGSTFYTGKISFPNANATIAGNAGFDTSWVDCSVLSAARTYTLTQGNTYTIGTNNLYTTSGFRPTLASSHATNKVVVNVSRTAIAGSCFCDFTRIDARGGAPLLSFGSNITSSYNCTNVWYGANIIGDTGGETLTIAGVTKDNNGDVLGSCVCYLFIDNGNSTASFVKSMTSDPTTGVYSFSVYPGSTYFVVAFKSGSPAVMDVTDRTLVAA